VTIIADPTVMIPKVNIKIDTGIVSDKWHLRQQELVPKKALARIHHQGAIIENPAENFLTCPKKGESSQGSTKKVTYPAWRNAFESTKVNFRPMSPSLTK
jgi:hypothetical protein